MTAETLSLRERIWPVSVAGVRGWPLPDAAWDEACGFRADVQGWLPWAVWQSAPDWYIAFYSCDRGHAWTCGHGSVAGPGKLRGFALSPVRTMPSDAYLREHVAEPDTIRLRIVGWPER
jgi:hypothetical protein